MKKIEEIKFDRYYEVASASDLGILAQGIAECVASAFQGGVTQEDAIRHMSGDIVLVNKDIASNEVRAFSAMVFASPNEIFNTKSISDQKGAYFAAATVRKEIQGQGFYRAMNYERIKEALDAMVPLVFTRTQNPQVQAGIESVLEEMILDGKIKSYQLERIKVAGAYGKMLTREKPYSNSVSFDELDLETGDAYLLIFKISYHNLESTYE